MATTLTNSAEGGTNGTTLTAGSGGNTGGASGNFFDAIARGTGATLAFDNTHAAHGALSIQQTVTTTAANSYVEWTASLTTAAQVWFRVYMYNTGAPGTSFPLITFLNSGTVCAQIKWVVTSGAFACQDKNGATAFSLNAGPTNQWFRLEGFVVGDPTVGQISLSRYDNMDSVTASQTNTATGRNTLNVITTMRVGAQGSFTNLGPFWVDDLGISTTGALGPVSSGSTNHGSTLASLGVG